MKFHTSHFLLIAVLTTIILLLSACQVNLITDIKGDGSGVYSQEIGFQANEAEMAGMTPGDQNFCAGQNDKNPPGTSVRQETRNGNETWCIFETAFKSLDDLKTIYGATDIRINEISASAGKITYDVVLDLTSENNTTSAPTGSEFFWIVNMPGRITENNATKQDGNTLKWTLQENKVNNIRAVSETGGTNLAGIDLGTISPYVYGGACLCMCGFAIVVIGVVVFLVLRRNKKKTAASEPPVEMPVP